VTERADHALSISVAEPVSGVFVVSLVGDLDATSLDELSRQLAELRGKPRARVVVDVSGLEFIDSSGLNALVTGARAVEAHEGSMVVAGAPHYVARVFELVRLGESVEVEASVEEALRRAEADAAAEQIGHSDGP
jgi:anti-sigma B factor antagonist